MIAWANVTRNPSYIICSLSDFPLGQNQRYSSAATYREEVYNGVVLAQQQYWMYL